MGCWELQPVNLLPSWRNSPSLHFVPILTQQGACIRGGKLARLPRQPLPSLATTPSLPPRSTPRTSASATTRGSSTRSTVQACYTPAQLLAPLGLLLCKCLSFCASPYRTPLHTCLTLDRPGLYFVALENAAALLWRFILSEARLLQNQSCFTISG